MSGYGQRRIGEEEEVMISHGRVHFVQDNDSRVTSSCATTVQQKSGMQTSTIIIITTALSVPAAERKPKEAQ